MINIQTHVLAGHVFQVIDMLTQVGYDSDQILEVLSRCESVVKIRAGKAQDIEFKECKECNEESETEALVEDKVEDEHREVIYENTDN